MNQNTLFKSATPIEVTTIEEALKQAEKENFHSEGVFAEECELKYDDTCKEFEATLGPRTARFSRTGFLRFCGAVGVPSGFALKVPNDLLLTNVNTLLEGSSAKKLKIVYRGNTVVSVIRPGVVWTAPMQVLDHAKFGLQERKLVEDRVVVTDDGVVVNAYETPVSLFDIGDKVKNDPFDLGIRLDYGQERSGLLKSSFFSRRHSCLNVAYALNARELKGAFTYERLRNNEQKPALPFTRFHERMVLPAGYIDRMKQAHLNLTNAPVLDGEYVPLFNSVSKAVGFEPALAVFQHDESTHDVIVNTWKVKKAKAETEHTNLQLEPVKNLNRYDIFNRVTALGRAYVGQERLSLEELGGSLLVF